MQNWPFLNGGIGPHHVPANENLVTFSEIASLTTNSKAEGSVHRVRGHS